MHTQVSYALRHVGAFSFCHLDVVLGHHAPDENMPVYVSYMWDDYETSSGHDCTILLAKGRWQHGHFTAELADGSGDFAESDYESSHAYDGQPSRWFKAVSGRDFGRVVDSMQTIFFCGGVTFLAVKALLPNFMDEGQELAEYPNP